MKRIIPVLAAAAALLAGCAAPPAALPAATPTPGPAFAVPSGPTPASSFYQLHSYDDSAGTLLYGQNRVIYQGPNEARFVEDAVSSQRTGYYRRVVAADAFHYELYDLDGTLLLDCGELAPLQRMGDWVLLGPASGADIYSCIDNYFYNLRTGEKKLPGHTGAERMAPGLYKVLTVDLQTGLSTGKLVDEALDIIQDLSPYTCYPLADDPGYLELNGQVGESWQSALYEISTGRILTGLAARCGPSLACFAAEGGYQVVELATGRELLHSEQSVLWYSDGLTAMVQPDGTVTLTASGSTYTGSNFYAQNGFAQLRSQEGDTFLFDLTGKLLGQFSQTEVSSLGSTKSGNVILYLAGSEDSSVQLCSPTLERLTPAGRYADISPLYTPLFNESRLPYFTARRAGRPYQTSLYDILDQQGNIVLADLNQIYEHDEYGLAVRKGFRQGIMDWQGNWVYETSIFTGFEDEVESLW